MGRRSPSRDGQPDRGETDDARADDVDLETVADRRSLPR
jgi:hypothetical protein